MSQGQRTDLRHAAQAARIQEATANYLASLAKLASIEQCPSYWPADPMGPDSMGTRCDLVAEHRTPHRHKPKGATQAVITW